MRQAIILYKKVEETIRRYDMINAGDKVIVAVSGGPDSVFLLHALDYLSKRIAIELLVANLDHGMRGKESISDSRFVLDLSGRLDIKCHHEKIRISRKDLSLGISTEELLRKKRYEFFKKIASKARATVLATGHTLDDQAETILMRIIKGATMKGLVGILPTRMNNNIRIIRPLIHIEKNDILVFMKKNKMHFRTDRTNTDEKYFRNVTRKKILPYLSKYNPRLKRSLSQMAESLQEDYDFIETEKAKRDLISAKNGKITINLRDIVIQPKSLQREILRDAIIKTGASVKKLTYRHWKEMDNFIRFKRRGQSIDLPGGVIMKREEKTLSLNQRN